MPIPSECLCFNLWKWLSSFSYFSSISDYGYQVTILSVRFDPTLNTNKYFCLKPKLPKGKNIEQHWNGKRGSEREGYKESQNSEEMSGNWCPLTSFKSKMQTEQKKNRLHRSADRRKQRRTTFQQIIVYECRFFTVKSIWLRYAMTTWHQIHIIYQKSLKEKEEATNNNSNIEKK